MLRKKVEIDGREVEFKASAAVPRIYRMKFRRDLFMDLQKIAKSVKKKGKKEDKESSEIPIEDLEMFENIAYVMAQHADPENVPPDIMDWLEQFNTFSIYQILPAILELWNRPSSRELNTPLFLLRCCQVGISIRDLDLLTVGMVMDMFTEQQNDSYKYPRMATQEDFDKF